MTALAALMERLGLGGRGVTGGGGGKALGPQGGEGGGCVVVDGEVGPWRPGDDGCRAQQGLRAQGGPAGPYWSHGRFGLDAGAGLRGGGGEQGRAAHVPDRAPPGRGG